jgi:Mg2+ and Co2+ transporter CorA
MLKNIRKSIHKLKEEHQLINSHIGTYYDESAEDDYLDFFTRVITSLLHGERSSIYINDPQNETVWFEVGTGAERKHVSEHKEDSMVGRAIASGKAEINNDMDTQEGTRNAICVPVKSMDKKQVTGVIQVVNKENKESFNEEDQKWLEDIAHNIQFNIEHISLHQGSLSLSDKILETSNKLLTMLAVLFLLLVGGFTLFLLILWLAT